MKSRIGSMDVNSLYTKIKGDVAAEIVKNEIKQSNIKLEGLDVEEMGKYLRTNLTSKQIEEKGMEDIIPFKKKKKRKKKKEI